MRDDEFYEQCKPPYRSMIFLLVLLIFIFAVAIFGCAPTPPSNPNAPIYPDGVVRPATPVPAWGNAPEFTASTLAGSSLRLSDYRGKVVLLSFWASWCGPCMDEIDHEKQIANRYASKPFQLIGINRDRTKLAARTSARINELTWPNIWDEAPAVSRLYSVESLPTFVLIDKQGNLAGRWIGSGKSLDISAAIEKELAK